MVSVSLPFSPLVSVQIISKIFHAIFLVFTNPIVSPNGTVNVIEGSNLTMNLLVILAINGQTVLTGNGLTSAVSQNQVPLALSFTNIKRTDSGAYL